MTSDLRLDLVVSPCDWNWDDSSTKRAAWRFGGRVGGRTNKVREVSLPWTGVWSAVAAAEQIRGDMGREGRCQDEVRGCTSRRVSRDR